MYLKAKKDCDGLCCEMKSGECYELPDHLAAELLKTGNVVEATAEQFAACVKAREASNAPQPEAEPAKVASTPSAKREKRG